MASLPLITPSDCAVILVDYQAGLAFAAGSAEVLAAEPTADYDAKWGGFVIDGKNSPVSFIRESDRCPARSN